MPVNARHRRAPRRRRPAALVLVGLGTGLLAVAAALSMGHWRGGPPPDLEREAAASTRWQVDAGGRAQVTEVAGERGRRSVVRPAESGTLSLRRADVVGASRPAASRAVGGWDVRVWMRSSRRQPVALQVTGPAGSGPEDRGEGTRRVPADRWVPVDARVPGRVGNGAFRVRVVLPDARDGDRVDLEDSSVRALAAKHLSNGCVLTLRGVPACGALLGAAHGANSDPSELEDSLGRTLGLRRTYWRGDQVAEGVRTAREDLAQGRLPWISFKLPASWEEMDSPEGEAWARDLAERLARLPGPVWVAFHHEPEYDGDIRAWRRMQERFIPVVRRTAPNVAYTVVLTGYHQLYGEPSLGLDRIFPDGHVDVAAFDVYNEFGVVKNGRANRQDNDVVEDYFEPLSAWARERRVAWALGETGYSDEAIEEFPGWVDSTYADLVELGGVAFAYFDTRLNSIADWTLDEPAKLEDFRTALADSPRFPRWPADPSTADRGPAR